MTTRPSLPTIVRLAVLLAVGVAAGCFRGGERDKEAPAGLLGGKCLAPPNPGAPPYCDEGLCNENRNYCYDPADPCEGFFCGGSDRGLCQVDGQFPSCICDAGFNHDQYDLYCCPDAGSGVVDPRCGAAGGDGDGDGGGFDDAAATTGDGASESSSDGSGG